MVSAWPTPGVEGSFELLMTLLRTGARSQPSPRILGDVDRLPLAPSLWESLLPEEVLRPPAELAWDGGLG